LWVKLTLLGDVVMRLLVVSLSPLAGILLLVREHVLLHWLRVRSLLQAIVAVMKV
jgi:hypothetical protein